jgi:hypothetical protein
MARRPRLLAISLRYSCTGDSPQEKALGRGLEDAPRWPLRSVSAEQESHEKKRGGARQQDKSPLPLSCHGAPTCGHPPLPHKGPPPATGHAKDESVMNTGDPMELEPNRIDITSTDAFMTRGDDHMGPDPQAFLHPLAPTLLSSPQMFWAPSRTTRTRFSVARPWGPPDLSGPSSNLRYRDLEACGTTLGCKHSLSLDFKAGPREGGALAMAPWRSSLEMLGGPCLRLNFACLTRPGPGAHATVSSSAQGHDDWKGRFPRSGRERSSPARQLGHASLGLRSTSLRSFQESSGRPGSAFTDEHPRTCSRNLLPKLALDRVPIFSLSYNGQSTSSR